MKMLKRENINKILIHLIVWTLVGLYRAIQWLQYSRGAKWQIITLALSNLYLWAILFPLMSFIILKIIRKGMKWYWNILPQIPLSMLFTLIHLIMYFYINTLLSKITNINPYTPDFSKFISSLFLYELFFCIQILAVIYLLEFRRLFEERKLQASQLAKQLTTAKLHSLKTQLHPHFLFNTLNSIHSLMDINLSASKKMLTRLSDFLRMTLDGFENLEISFNAELDYIKNYLEIEQIRFKDRLMVKFEIDPETYDAQLPSLILQPIVENALRYGIVPFSKVGEIKISSKRDNKNLIIVVQDNGPGCKDIYKNKSGIGLMNVKERLAKNYGERQQLEYGNLPEGGFFVKITIPFSPSPILRYN